MSPGAEPDVLTSTLSRNISEEDLQKFVAEEKQRHRHEEHNKCLNRTADLKQLFKPQDQNFHLIRTDFDNFLQTPPTLEKEHFIAYS